MRALFGIGAVVAALHVAGFSILLAAPSGLAIGVGITAYTLGLRHAFDADHIAAIDNTTRRLSATGQNPVGAGFFFSLGHSTVVFALAILIAAGADGLSGAVEDDGSALHAVTTVFGPLVSGSFLVAIGLVNLAAMRRDPEPRVFRRATRAVREPWHTYPLGFLFGLGFDTATEVALLALAAAGAAGGLPWYAVLCLPLLFAAGMCLLDTLDGVFMSYAYGWAAAEPDRRRAYNTALTGISVAAALAVGMAELLSLEFQAQVAGYLIAGCLAAVWLAGLGFSLRWRA